MPWGAAQDRELLDFYRRLVAARRDRAGTWRGDRRTVALDDATGLLAYRCGDGSADAIVVLDTSEAATEFRPADAETWQLGLVTDGLATYDEGVLRLPARSGAILVGGGRTDRSVRRETTAGVEEASR